MGFDLARDFPGLGKAMSRIDADHFGKLVHDTRSEKPQGTGPSVHPGFAGATELGQMAG